MELHPITLDQILPEFKCESALNWKIDIYILVKGRHVSWTSGYNIHLGKVRKGILKAKEI